ncbi:replication initiator [Micromonospora avicenniae]|uniref:replication initiator n=1 Tax=Micromonospora avicenniae TaxID=1198245 RepID=UPI003F57B3CE
MSNATRPDYSGWLEHVRSAAGCTRPIPLTGQILTVDSSTGRVVEQRHTDAMPDAASYRLRQPPRHRLLGTTRIW